jgi:hypothetical protein
MQSREKPLHATLKLLVLSLVEIEKLSLHLLPRIPEGRIEKPL